MDKTGFGETNRTCYLKWYRTALLTLLVHWESNLPEHQGPFDHSICGQQIPCCEPGTRFNVVWMDIRIRAFQDSQSDSLKRGERQATWKQVQIYQ